MIAPDHHRRRDAGQPLQGGDPEPQRGKGGAVGVEEVACVDDEVGLLGGGDRQKLPKGGAVVFRPVVAPQFGAEVPVGGVEEFHE